MTHHRARYWIIRAHLLGAYSGLVVGMLQWGFWDLFWVGIGSTSFPRAITTIGSLVILPGVVFGLAMAQLFDRCGRRGWLGHTLAMGVATALVAFGVAPFISIAAITVVCGNSRAAVLIVPSFSGLVSAWVLLSGFRAWARLGTIPLAVKGWMLAAGLLGGLGFGLVFLGLIGPHQDWLLIFLYLPGHLLTAGPLGWLRWKMTEKANSPGGPGQVHA